MSKITFQPQSGSRVPVFLQLSRAIAADIERGQLRPGERLPGSRKLAQTLGLHRNTVLAAVAELVSQGWLETAPARGTFVSQRVPALPESGVRKRVAAKDRQTAYPLRLGPNVSRPVEHAFPRYVLAGGTPDARLFPKELLARAMRRTLRLAGERVLDYGDARGQVRLRAALAQMLSERRGLSLQADDVVVTRGSQMGIWLVAHSLVTSGDWVAVERYGYRPAWDALRATGARLCPVGVDEDGVDVIAIEKLAASKNLRAVYVTPHHQFPTLCVMAADRRLRLLALARKYRFAIIEDDYDNEYHFSGTPVLPLASYDQHGSVVYVGTLSKVLAPGLRLGYVVAPRALLAHLVARRIIIDRQGDATTELAVAELLEDGEVQRHIRKTKRIYEARRQQLVTSLRETLGEALTFLVPEGGLALWVELNRRYDVAAWVKESLARGVWFSPGSDHEFHGRRSQYARIGFGRTDEGEIRTAVRLLRDALEPARR